MKRIDVMVNGIQRKEPDWSSFVCFAMIVLENFFSKTTIWQAFNRLVEKDDYAEEDKEEILEDLLSRKHVIWATYASATLMNTGMCENWIRPGER